MTQKLELADKDLKNYSYNHDKKSRYIYGGRQRKFLKGVYMYRYTDR